MSVVPDPDPEFVIAELLVLLLSLDLETDERRERDLWISTTMLNLWSFVE